MLSLMHIFLKSILPVALYCNNVLNISNVLLNTNLQTYSCVPNNRVYQLILFEGNLQLTCQRVVPNNRVERIFPTLGQKQMFFFIILFVP